MLHHLPGSPPPETTAPVLAPALPEPLADTLCAGPGCHNLVSERWEETGRFCARCAIEEDLYDREARRERAFGLTVF